MKRRIRGWENECESEGEWQEQMIGWGLFIDGENISRKGGKNWRENWRGSERGNG